MLSNIQTYLAIAEEAAVKAKYLQEQIKKPKPDGSPGFVINNEVKREAFKQNLIAMAFSGIYFEALICITGTMILSTEEYKKIEREKYEQKLHRLGIRDENLLTRCKHFREVRNDLIHEKAIEAHRAKSSDFRMAHIEAAESILFIKDAANALRKLP